jgi:hypothetical protein
MTFTLETMRKSLTGLTGGLADWTLEGLLHGMQLGFGLPTDFRDNIKGFQGVYVFGSKDGSVAASAVFDHETMDVLEEALDNWDIKIVFKDERAFWKLIFSGGDDVLGAILENDVEVYGNLNYLYKFGYMAKDLVGRLGVPWKCV